MHTNLQYIIKRSDSSLASYLRKTVQKRDSKHVTLQSMRQYADKSGPADKQALREGKVKSCTFLWDHPWIGYLDKNLWILLLSLVL